MAGCLRPGPRHCITTINTAVYPSRGFRSAASDENEAHAEAPSGKNVKRAANRFRQHVNPLSSKYQVSKVPVGKLDWLLENFEDPTLPLHLDVGCAKGTFVLEMAEKMGENVRRDGTGFSFLILFFLYS